MELQAKLLKARVWLPQRALQAQDGFLAVTRVANCETLTYGALDEAQAQATPRKPQSVALKWTEREERTADAFQLVCGDGQEPPKLELLLFTLLASTAQGESSSHRHQQRIEYIGRSVLRLSARDVDVMRAQHEVVFSTTLDGGLGALDVKLKRSCSPSDKQQQEQKHVAGDADEQTADDAHAARGSFSVNWSSSEALKKDLEEKGDIVSISRLKAKGEKKLLVQLRKVFVSALHAAKQRDKELRRRRIWYAAAKIQRAYRALLNRRQEARECIRREQLALQEAKKVRVREKVVERNRQRAQAMREQLRSFTSGGHACPASRSTDNNNSNNYNNNSSSSRTSARRGGFAQIRAEKQSVELAKLQRRLAELETERDDALRAANAQKHRERGPESSHLMSCKQSRPAVAQYSSAIMSSSNTRRSSGHSSSTELLDARLMRAIQTLHFGATRKCELNSAILPFREAPKSFEAIMSTVDSDAMPSTPAAPEAKGPELQIKNFVCSANLGMRFDLASLLTKSHKKAELVPKKNCLVMKLAHPKATAMLFANGKLVCTGAETEEAIKGAARKFTQVIQKMDHPGVNLIDFKIQNVVGTCELGFRVLVEELSFAYNDHCTYEPELYPALIYRLDKPKVKILVFVSGKVVFTGSKEPRELHAAFDAIVPILRQFKDTKHVETGSEDADSEAAKKLVGQGNSSNASGNATNDDDEDQSMMDDE